MVSEGLSMKVHNELYNLCGLVDRTEKPVRIPSTDFNLVDYRIEPPVYRLYIDINGQIKEFTHPINMGLQSLVDELKNQSGQIKQRHARAKIVTRSYSSV